mgnify:CR=1 FL=1
MPAVGRIIRAVSADALWFEAHPEQNPFTRPAAAAE